MEQDNTLDVFQPSENHQLSTALLGMEEQFARAARSNVENNITPGDYTQAELEAMITIEQLRLLNGMDLAAILMRGRLLKRIEEQNLWANHPAGYTTLKEMAQAQGISITELSNVKDLTQIVFPYIEEELDLPVAQVWERMKSKSNMIDMLPILKAMITGEMPPQANTRANIEQIMNNTAATLQTAGQPHDDQAVRRQVVDDLLLAAEQETNRAFRARVRPERTPAPRAAVVRISNREYYIAEIADTNQRLAMERKLGAYLFDAEVFDVDQGQRQQEQVRRIPLLRSLLGG